GQEHARGADPALHRAFVDEGLLEPMEGPVRAEPLDRGDPAIPGAYGQEETRAHRLAVDQSRAGSADALATAVLRPAQAQGVGQELEEGPVGRHLHLVEAVVHPDRERRARQRRPRHPVARRSVARAGASPAAPLAAARRPAKSRPICALLARITDSPSVASRPVSWTSTRQVTSVAAPPAASRSSTAVRSDTRLASAPSSPWPVAARRAGAARSVTVRVSP